MNAVWSYNLKSHITKAELCIAKASVVMWKKNNPEHTTNLHCNAAMFDVITKEDMVKLWDNVTVVDRIPNINENVFWASSKIASIASLPAPIVHIDLDFYSKEPFDLFKSDVSVCYKETLGSFYLNDEDGVAGIKFTKPPGCGFAYNTCIVYFKDNRIKDKYTSMCMEYMIKMSHKYNKDIHKKETSKYMTFVEQKMLADLCESKGVKVDFLVKNVFDSDGGVFIKNAEHSGLMTIDEVENTVVHLGDYKNKLRVSVIEQESVINKTNQTLVDFLLR